jgi:hypothetical protein
VSDSLGPRAIALEGASDVGDQYVEHPLVGREEALVLALEELVEGGARDVRTVDHVEHGDRVEPLLGDQAHRPLEGQCFRALWQAPPASRRPGEADLPLRKGVSVDCADLPG